MYGVNLGGWMVLEPFVTASLFLGPQKVNPNVIDEWTLCQFYGPETAYQVMHNHWDTWVTEQDIFFLAYSGVTHVRIPLGKKYKCNTKLIGYWVLLTQEELNQYGEPYVTGGWQYVVRAVQWTKKYPNHWISSAILSVVNARVAYKCFVRIFTDLFSLQLTVNLTFAD